MKNKDLIKRLKKFPPDGEVVIRISAWLSDFDINVSDDYSYNHIKLSTNHKHIKLDYDNFVGGFDKDGLYICNECGKIYSKKELNEIKVKNKLTIVVKCNLCNKGEIEKMKT